MSSRPNFFQSETLNLRKPGKQSVGDGGGLVFLVLLLFALLFATPIAARAQARVASNNQIISGASRGDANAQWTFDLLVDQSTAFLEGCDIRFGFNASELDIVSAAALMSVDGQKFTINLSEDRSFVDGWTTRLDMAAPRPLCRLTVQNTASPGFPSCKGRLFRLHRVFPPDRQNRGNLARLIAVQETPV